MRVYLFRHAERENSGQADPPLTPHGRQQAREIGKQIESGAWDKPDRLWISPRRRTFETFAPASIAVGVSTQIMPELDERQSAENGAQFTQRVRKLLGETVQTPGVTYLCTHLDWIEEAMIAIPSPEDLLALQHQIWSPAQHMVFDVEDGLWHLRRQGGVLT